MIGRLTFDIVLDLWSQRDETRMDDLAWNSFCIYSQAYKLRSSLSESEAAAARDDN